MGLHSENKVWLSAYTAIFGIRDYGQNSGMFFGKIKTSFSWYNELIVETNDKGAG